MNGLVIALAASAGAALGPFLRTEIVRNSVPVGGPEAEACPHCGSPVARRTAWLMRAPLPVSGRCRACANRLGPPAASVELVTAAIFALLAWRFTDPLTLLAMSWAALWGVVLSFIDIRVHRLPNRLVLVGLTGTATVLTLAAIRHHDMSRLIIAGLCALGAMTAYLLLALLPASFGMGDIKASAITGLTAGWFGIASALYAFVGGLVLGGIAATVVLVTRPGSARRSIAHGPFTFAGAFLAVLTATG